MLKKDAFLIFFRRLQCKPNQRHCSSLFWGGRPQRFSSFSEMSNIFFSHFYEKDLDSKKSSIFVRGLTTKFDISYVFQKVTKMDPKNGPKRHCVYVPLAKFNKKKVHFFSKKVKNS
jgi:hypothetical protein